MAFKATDAVLNDAVMRATENEIEEGINKLIDRKIHLALAKIMADLPDASVVISDAQIRAQSDQLKKQVAELISSKEKIITVIAKGTVEALGEKSAGASAL